MDDNRFEHLMSRLPDDELSAGELTELCRLARASPDRQAELQSQLEAAGLITQAEDVLRDSPVFVAATLDRIGGDPFVAGIRSAIARGVTRPRRVPQWSARWPWAIAAAAIVALIASVAWLRPKEESKIVWITALDGSVQWTGDGGRVNGDLRIGRSLSGGTLESLSAESWAVLEFRDGSTVTVSGLSMLTIAEGTQKELHLRQGSLSASVSRQPAGERMVIHTPTAKLEILGTQLSVDAEPSSTVLDVNEGRVRVTRLVDGRVAEVSADQRIVASLDRLGDYEARRRSEPVHSWKADLPKDAKHGRWIFGKGEQGDGLQATPFLVTCGRPVPLLLYLASFSVASSNSPPVRLSHGVRFQLQGHLKATGTLYFGLTMQHPKGGFAGKYIASRSAQVSEENGGPFDVEFRLDEFKPEEARFPATPIGLELFDCWSFTIHQDIGLAISHVELVAAGP